MNLFSRRKVLGSIFGAALGSLLLPVKRVSELLHLKATGIAALVEGQKSNSPFAERDSIRPRGIVKIKPVYIAIKVNFPWSYPNTPLSRQQVEERTRQLADRFKENSKVDFVRLETPLIIAEHSDFRKLKAELSYDTDALLVGGERLPLIDYSLSRIGLPLIWGQADVNFLRGLRVKKVLSESKVLYFGEYPSDSIRYTNSPRHLFNCEDRFGIRVRQIDTHEFYSLFDSHKEDKVRKELENWRKDFDETSQTDESHKLSLVKDEKDLLDATRIYLTFRDLVLSEDANGICVNCNKLWIQNRKHIFPCLAYDRLISEGIMCACEGDMGNMVSSLILNAVSGDQPVLQGNTRWRPDEGIIYIQHDIIPFSMARTKHKIRNYHAKGWGVTAYAEIDNQNGPMTVININSGFSKVGVVEGKIRDSYEPTDKEASEGACRFRVNMTIRGDLMKAQPVLNVGSQHNAMTFGHWLPALEEAGKLLDLEVVHLEY